MPSIVQPVAEGDIPAFYDVAYDALSNDGPWALVYPNGITDADRKFGSKTFLHDWTTKRERHFFMKSVESGPSGLPHISGVARFILYQTKAQLEGEATALLQKVRSGTLAYAPSMDQNFRAAFLETVASSKLEFVRDDAFLYVQLLAVNSDSQGKGIGSALMEYGTQKADSLGLPAYVESSVAGQRLYEKFGFEVISHLHTPGEPWSTDKRASLLVMRRPAKVAKN